MKGDLLFLLAVMFLLQADRSTVLGAFGSSDKVKLKDVQVLTLHSGRMTTGRRSSPVPQLKCVGGSAAHSYVPQVVQCYNRGSDGVDIQWECKADMDNAYRFGQVQVSCEGYDYPDDEYILKGSCGLEYTLELTKEGYEQQDRNQYQKHDYYGESQGYDSYYSGKKRSNTFGDLITLAIVGVIIYAIYRTCIAGNGNQTSDDQPDGSRGPPPPYTPRGGPTPSAPPPPGFRDEYMPGSGYDDGNCHSTRSHTHTRTSTNTGGGFWSGAATGGILGYLFGSRTNTGYARPHNPGWGGGWGRGWGSSGWGGGNTWGGGSWGTPTRTVHRSSGWGGSSGNRGSTGTRTASGFGGTSRR